MMNFGLTVICMVLSTLSFTDGACVTSLDIAILLDESTSVGLDGFKSIQQFAIDMISNMDVGPDKARVCLVRFTLEPTVEFDLKNYTSALELEEAVSELDYNEGATGIEDGLYLAADELFNEEGGARLNAVKFLVVFSDGDFAPFSPDPRMDGINVLAIGSGATVYEAELKTLVQNPSEDFFTTREDQPENVILRMGDLAQQICIGL